jgi:hypothetical protein
MKMTSSKRFAVRTALVTGTTLATIIGAQALASLDETAFSKTPPASVAPAEISAQANSAPVFSTTPQAPAAAPNIVILRHASKRSSVTAPVPQTNTGASNSQAVIIQPPNPVQVAAPQPVPQASAPVVARTRSSR